MKQLGFVVMAVLAFGALALTGQQPGSSASSFYSRTSREWGIRLTRVPAEMPH